MPFAVINLFVWALLMDRIEIANLFWKIEKVSFKFACAMTNKIFKGQSLSIKGDKLFLLLFHLKYHTSTALFAYYLLKKMGNKLKNVELLKKAE